MIDPIKSGKAHQAGGPNRPTGASDKEKTESREATLRMQLTGIGGSTKQVKGSKAFRNEMGGLQTELPGLLKHLNARLPGG